MKELLYSVTSYLLTVTLFAITAPPAPRAMAKPHGPRQNGRQRIVRDMRIRSGPEVAALVNRFKEQNADVRAALKAFERNGRRPQIEKALAISGTLAESGMAGRKGPKESAFQKVSFRQQETVSGNGYEAVWIPVVETATEWQGTVVFTKYDEYGNPVEQRTHDVVLVDDYADGNWRGAFEVSYQDGASWLAWQEGMIDDQYFQWGVTLQEQPNREQHERQMQVEMQMQARLNPVTFMRAGFSLTSGTAHSRPSFRLVQNGLSPPAFQYDPRTGRYTGYRYPPAPPRVREYAVNTAFGCGGARVGCGPDWRCVLRWCAGAAVANLPILFR